MKGWNLTDLKQIDDAHIERWALRAIGLVLVLALAVLADAQFKDTTRPPPVYVASFKPVTVERTRARALAQSDAPFFAEMKVRLDIQEKPPVGPM